MIFLWYHVNAQELKNPPSIIKVYVLQTSVLDSDSHTQQYTFFYKKYFLSFFAAIIVVRNRDNCEKRRCLCHLKQCKTLSKDHPGDENLTLYQ